MDRGQRRDFTLEDETSRCHHPYPVFLRNTKKHPEVRNALGYTAMTKQRAQVTVFLETMKDTLPVGEFPGSQS